jgi:hypothetical protein
MSPEPTTDDPAITQVAVTCKIIAGALVFGVVAFAAVAVVLRLGQAPGGSLVSSVAAGLAAAVVVVRQVVLGVMGGRTGPSSMPGPIGALALYQTRMIVGLALLEGAAFFNIVSYIIEGQWWTLLVVAVLVAFMLAAFPTRTRLRRWVEDREQLKTFGPDGT